MIAFAYVLFSRTLPPPTGPYAVGRTELFWEDSSRPELWTDDPNDTREISVQVWYPAETPVDTATAAYITHLSELRHEFKLYEWLGVATMACHSHVDAPLPTGDDQYPVLVFSPGADTVPALYSTILEELASHGYIVIALDHTYEGKGQAFPDGRIMGPDADREAPSSNTPDFDAAFNAFYRKRVDVRAADAEFVLNQLEHIGSNDERFAQRLDLSHTGIFGHSIGGVAAAEAAKLEPRWIASVNLDGLMAGLPIPADGTVISGAFMFLGKALRAMEGLTPDDTKRNQENGLTRIAEAIRTVKGPACAVTLPDATHQTFTDEPFLFPGGSAKKTRLLTAVRTYLVAFFDASIRNKPPTLFVNERLSAPTEITIEMFHSF